MVHPAAAPYSMQNVRHSPTDDLVRVSSAIEPVRLPLVWGSSRTSASVLAAGRSTADTGIAYSVHRDQVSAAWTSATTGTKTVYHISPARHMIESGELLPKNYTYPSIDKWLVLWPAIPVGVRATIDANGEPVAIQAAMLAAMNASGYLLRARSVFIIVSSFAILWTYGAALALRHRRWEALVAAASLGLSWEFAYHSRWAVTDCILVQFSALTLFMLALFQRTGRPRWLYAASVAAGLCTGTKYTGVVLLIAVVRASALSLPAATYLAQVRRAAELCALAFAVYLVSTPGTVLDPFQFRTDTHFIATYYQHTHGGYTVSSGWQHAGIVLSYLALALFSPYPALAAVLFAAVIAGAGLWLKRDIRFAAVLVGLPLIFLTLFCARYRLAIVRNYLFLTPFFAVMLARGVADFMRWPAMGGSARALRSWTARRVHRACRLADSG